MTHAPYTPEQVASINAYQQEAPMHPFTCCEQDMTAHEDGMHCASCGVVQTWVHPWMADGSWRRFVAVVSDNKGDGV